MNIIPVWENFVVFRHSCFFLKLYSIRYRYEINYFLLGAKVADPHHLTADPDPAFYFNTDSDLIKVMLVYRTSRLNFEPPALCCDRPRPSTAQC
jgi:hypothetical protein